MLPPYAVVALAVAAAPLLSSPARAEDPLPKLAQEAGGSLCFRRTYDAAHLQRHSGQRTMAALAFLKYGADAQAVWLGVRLVQKGREAAADMMAGCEWSVGANRDTSGRRLMPAYRKNEGFVCLATYSPSSAEEAGTIVFDLPADGRTLTLYLDDQIGLWSAVHLGGRTRLLKLGRDDRSFRLDRTDAADCRDLERDLQTD